MKKLITLFLLCFFSCTLNVAWATKTVAINKDTPDLVLDVKYPQGFEDKNIDVAIESFINEAQKNYMPEPDPNLPADVPGKNGLYIDYENKFQQNKALSLMFMISANTRGTAHPSNMIRSLNFVDGKPVKLEQLFKPDSNYLVSLAAYCKKALSKESKDKFDDSELATGTKPSEENYNNWYFTTDGLAIVFDTYQVAAYVYGPQTVKIPRVELKNLRPEMAKAIWGNE